MIARFLASKFSGYLAIGLVISLLASHGYVYWSGWSGCNDSQSVANSKAAQEQVSTEVRISEELQQKNRDVDKDEGSDLDIIRNTINRL